MFKDSGLNKFDGWSIGMALLGLAAGVAGTVFGFKANSIRTQQINNQIDPRITQIPKQ